VVIYLAAKPFALVTVLYVFAPVKSRRLHNGNNLQDGIGVVMDAGNIYAGDTTQNTSSLTAM
jgi:hypothetical protein